MHHQGSIRRCIALVNQGFPSTEVRRSRPASSGLAVNLAVRSSGRGGGCKGRKGHDRLTARWCTRGDPVHAHRSVPEGHGEPGWDPGGLPPWRLWFSEAYRALQSLDRAPARVGHGRPGEVLLSGPRALRRRGPGSRSAPCLLWRVSLLRRVGLPWRLRPKGGCAQRQGSRATQLMIRDSVACTVVLFTTSFPLRVVTTSVTLTVTGYVPGARYL